MTLGIVGALLLVLLLYLWWRDRYSIATTFAALLLGFIIAQSNGPLGTFANAAVDGIRTAGTAIANSIDSGHHK